MVGVWSGSFYGVVLVSIVEVIWKVGKGIGKGVVFSVVCLSFFVFVCSV